jgi:hypothetical protein
MSELSNAKLVVDMETISARAREFLRRHATVIVNDESPDVDAVPDVAASLNLPVEVVSANFTQIRERFWGLTYRSPAWSFDEVIGFYPELDADDSGDEQVVSLIEHSVAHPFGVWATLDGAIYYLFSGAHGGDWVKVFDTCESIIEADALYDECARWEVVGSGGAASADEIEARCTPLAELTEASGQTERWWQGAGFRVHVWRTWSAVFQQAGLTRWSLWIDPSAESREPAERFLEGVS